MSLEKFISQMGYRDDSPFKAEPYLDIYTPNGTIDMSNTGRSLMANGQILPPYSGIHHFDSNVVREIPLAQLGTDVMHQMPDGTWMPGATHQEYEEMELTDEEIAQYEAGGYVVEEIPKAQAGHMLKRTATEALQLSTDNDIESVINKYLDYPQQKSRANAYVGEGEDQSDNIRHASAGYLTSKAIADKTGSKTLGIIGANALGAAHELGTLVKDSRWKAGYDSWYEKAQVLGREALEDMYNNAYGTYLHSKGVEEKDALNYIRELSFDNKLPDGYGDGNMYWGPEGEDGSFNIEKKHGGSLPKAQYGVQKDGGDLPMAQDGHNVNYGTPEYKEAYDKGIVTRVNPETGVIQGSDLPEFQVIEKDPRLINAIHDSQNKFLSTAVESLGQPQKQMVEFFSGRQETPSEALGRHGHAGNAFENFLLDAVTDPMDLIGVGAVNDVMKVGKYAGDFVKGIKHLNNKSLIKNLENPDKFKKFIDSKYNNKNKVNWSKPITKYKHTQVNKAIKKLDKQLVKDKAAVENENLNTLGELMDRHDDLIKQHKQDRVNITSNYDQWIANKLRLPLNIQDKLGQGFFGSVWTSKLDPELAIKISKNMPWENQASFQHMVNVGKKLKNKKLALPKKAFTIPDTDRHVFHMDKLPKGQDAIYGNPTPTGEEFDELLGTLKTLSENNIWADFIGQDNIRHIPGEGFHIMDMFTEPGSYNSMAEGIKHQYPTALGKLHTKTIDYVSPTPPLPPNAIPYNFGTLPFQQGGEYQELELTDAEIKQYKRDGYIVEELPDMQSGGTVSEIWKERTGTPWSEAHRLGITKGSYDENIALRKRLLAGEFDKGTPQPSVSNPGENFSTAFARARREQGPGGRFEWNGSIYGTKYKNEVKSHTKPQQVEQTIVKPQMQSQPSQDMTSDESPATFNREPYIAPPTPFNIPGQPDPYLTGPLDSAEQKTIDPIGHEYVMPKTYFPIPGLNKPKEEVIDSIGHEYVLPKTYSPLPGLNTPELEQKAGPEETLATDLQGNINPKDLLNSLQESISIDNTPTALPSRINPFATEPIDKTKELFDKAMAVERPEQEAVPAMTAANYGRDRLKTLEKSKRMISKLKDPVLKDIEKAEPGLFDGLFDDLKEQYSDVTKYGEGWIKKMLVETTDVLSPEDKVATRKEVVTEKFIPPVKEEAAVTEFTDVFNEEVGYKKLDEGQSWLTGFPIHSFENAFDNDEGYNYIPTANVGNYKDTTYNSPGIAHFLLDADISEGKNYKHQYAKNMITNQLAGTNIQPGSTVEAQYFPVYEKKNGMVNMKYKTKAEFTKQDEKNIAAPLRQYHYDDIDWEGEIQPQGFKNNVKALPTTQKDDSGQPIASHLIYAKATGKDGWGDFSGTAVVFIINKGGKRLIVDYAGSVNNIKDKAQSLMNKYSISGDQLVIGMHDLGSFNSKPRGDKNNKLKFNPKEFNPHDWTGGGLAFPS